MEGWAAKQKGPKPAQIVGVFLLVGQNNARCPCKNQREGWAIAWYGPPIERPLIGSRFTFNILD
jgi:hypothetical protein